MAAPRNSLAGLIMVVALGVAGCTTATTADYIDLKTGQQYVCYRQAAFGAIPAAVSGSSYADCKSFFEGRGYVRRDPKTDAILRHLDPKLAESLSAPPSSPPPSVDDASTAAVYCRQRVASIGRREVWIAEYQRCMAGY